MFVDEYVANNIQTSDFDINNFGNKKTAIYILLPDDRDTYHRPVSYTHLTLPTKLEV